MSRVHRAVHSFRIHILCSRPATERMSVLSTWQNICSASATSLAITHRVLHPDFSTENSWSESFFRHGPLNGPSGGLP